MNKSAEREPDATAATDTVSDVARKTGSIAKREFLVRVAKRAEVPHRIVSTVYDAIIAEILESVGKGFKVTLLGFGKFYPQGHKGHRVQFKTSDNGTEVQDYAVLKFSATRAINRRIFPGVAAAEAMAAERAEAGEADDTDEDSTDS